MKCPSKVVVLLALAAAVAEAFRGASNAAVDSYLFSSSRRPNILKPSHHSSSLITRVANTDHSSSSSLGGEASSASEKDEMAIEKSGSSKSLLRTIDNVGLSLKPKAIKTSVKITLEERKSKKAWLLVKTSVLYSLFILYRAYRGFFVILPAVFREVYRKVDAVIDSPFDKDISVVNSSEAGNVDDDDDRRWRVRVTVGAVAAVVTASYVIHGAFRVLTKLARTVWKTSDVSSSFAAAADEQESNEDAILRLTNRMKINGEGSDGGLAP